MERGKNRNVNKESIKKDEQTIIKSSLKKQVLHIIKVYVCFYIKSEVYSCVPPKYRIQRG